MDYKQAIEHTKNKKGMKQSMPGILKKSSDILNAVSCGPIKFEEGESYAFVLDEISDHYKQARTAWLTGDLETVAEFFGVYV